MRNRVASLPAVLPYNTNGLPKQRRGSILDLLFSPAAPEVVRRSISSRQDYTSLKTTKERIEKAVQLFRTEILEPFLEDPEAESILQEIDSFLAAQASKGLTLGEVDQLKACLVNALAVDLKEVDHFKVMKTFGKAVLSYFDIFTDALVFADLVQKGNSRMALVQGGSLGFSFFGQSFMSLALGQPIWVALLGLVGMKPAIESFRDATQAKPFPNQVQENEMILFFSRMTEVILEAIPQAVVQTLVLLLYPEQRTFLQYFSLFTSFLTTGFVVAAAGKEIDTSKYRRKNEPLLFGYVPKIGSHRQMLASVSFFTLYKAAKVFSLCLFIASSSFRYVSSLLTLEYLGILAWRMACGNWRIYKRGLDGTGLSLFVHFCWYLCLLAAPFPLARMPTFFTPRVYLGSLVYMLGVNFGILVFSYRVFDGIDFLTETDAWLGLSFLTLLCLTSGFIAFRYVPDSHKPTFYKHWTFKEHAANNCWNGCVYARDHHHRITTDQDYICARIPTRWSPHYTPEEKIVEFYKQHWSDWCRDPPDWFDKEFKALIPEDLLKAVQKEEV